MKDKPVKFDVVPQLEVILKSIDLEDKNLLKPLFDSKEVPKEEKDIINKYLKLFEISGRPSTILLEKEIPRKKF